MLLFALFSIKRYCKATQISSPATRLKVRIQQAIIFKNHFGAFKSKLDSLSYT